LESCIKQKIEKKKSSKFQIADLEAKLGIMKKGDDVGSEEESEEDDDDDVVDELPPPP
jgi:hypothetical protein